MSDASKRSIPAWQQRENVQSSDAKPTSQTSEIPTPSHAELLDQAQDFLKEESIRSAPREKKVAFLEKKGLNSDDIEKLLAADTGEDERTSEELKTVHDSTTTLIPKETPSPKASTEVVVSRDTTSSPPPARDIPPIITYPEFLLKPQKPPPLVTVDRLLNAVYAIAGVTALSYGASKYIVEPMLSILTEARHDLANTAIQDLTKLNDKLMTTVSHVPYIPSLKSTTHTNSHNLDDDDNHSEASDPTEFFHRDIATQTTPALSRSSSSTSLKNTQPDTKTSSATLSHQLSTLSTLHTHLDDLLTTTLEDTSKDPYAPPSSTSRLLESVTQLQSVLDKLEHSSNPFRSSADSFIGSSGNTFTSADALKKGGTAKTDEATKFKAEIRALKGAFLSSRNFPTATRPAGVGYAR